MKSIRWSTIVVVVALTVFPWVVTSDYYRHIFIMALMWVVIGSAWNIISGYTGQVSFGHAIFYGTGAYTAGLLTIKLGISPWWGMLLGGPVALVVGLVIGWICFRLRGPYFALATIAIGEIFRLVATVWRDFTEGMQGIMIIRDIQDKIYYYYIALALAGLCIYAIHLVMRSKWGYYFVAIREDQDAAEAMGISSFRYKSLALICRHRRCFLHELHGVH
jgi:branched-chain amino acid transport system permease protein